MKTLLLVLTSPWLFSCAGHPTSSAPSWTTGPTRTVDAGYIVYLGHGEDKSPERATLAAEGMAIADLANECSFVPKGARIEDRYDEPLPDSGHRTYAKIGIPFEECEAAKKATDPDEVRKLANVAMTEELKRYQDIFYAAATPAGGGQAPGEIKDNSDYYVARQHVAYWKQEVILAPATVYVVGSPERVVYVTNITPAVTNLQAYETANPALRSGVAAPWSAVQRDSSYRIPPQMRPAASAAPLPPALRPAAQQQRQANRPAPRPKPQRRRRRKH
jgi:hypothetical protein